MSDQVALNTPENFDNMTAAEFEARLPDLIANNATGPLTEDPQFEKFFAGNPTCAALVRDLEAIAKAAKDLFSIEEPEEAIDEPVGDKMWESIANKIKVGGGPDDE